LTDDADADSSEVRPARGTPDDSFDEPLPETFPDVPPVHIGRAKLTLVVAPVAILWLANVVQWFSQAVFLDNNPMLLMALVVWRFVKNTPEEMGCSPDNVPMSAQEIAASRAEQAAYVSPFSTRRLLAMKDVWLIGIGSGGIYIVLVGVLSQLVPRMMEMGYSQGQAIANLSIAAFIGVPGAYIWGWLGQRFGSRKALMGYAAWWMVAVIVNMVQTNAVVLWISLVMIGLSFGGATNLTTSIVADKFSRGSFVKAFGLIQPIQGVVRTTAYAILAFGLTHLGGYVGAYGLLVAIAVVNIVIFWVVDTTPVEGDTVTETPAAAVA